MMPILPIPVPVVVVVVVVVVVEKPWLSLVSPPGLYS
jgi:hypothetical protein